jgi:hypothetical protein
MIKYPAQTLILGHNIKPDLAGVTLVGVPRHKFTDNDGVEVWHDGEVMYVRNPQDAIAEGPTWPDKFGRDRTYQLLYFEWRPQKRRLL